MHRTIPRVEDGRLFQSEKEGDPILVGTPAWYDWLEQQRSFTFIDRALTFTARKSVLRTGDSYWKAYRKRQGKLYRIRLGPSHTLTLEQLQAAAQAFAGEHYPGEQASVPWEQPVASRLPIPPSPRIALNIDNYTTLIQTKLYRPRLGRDLLLRTHLLERLNAGLGGKVTLVCAPAGFGKTTLLVEWIEMIDRPTAWLSLDENDDELAIFVRSLTAALQSVFPDAFGGTACLLLATRFPALDSLVALFINDLADVPEDLLLVLDDCHRIRTSEVHSFLELLVEHLPAQVHLVLSSRSDPLLPLARWRAQGYLNELRADDLRFTPSETEAFLARALGSAAAHQVTGTLEERTEGWIAILRLAALSLSNEPDQTAFLERLGHFPDRSVSTYLVEEVLNQQAPAVQELLVRTSILEQFCVQLCVAVMGTATSNTQVQAILEELERSNLFLVPLDERQGWYRLHHLFQGLLQQRLQAHSSQEELARLHLRASGWYAEQGLVDEAITHALAAGDASGAARLVEAQFLWAFEHERSVQMERWLRLVPEEQIQRSYCLLLARAWIATTSGQLTDFPRLLTTVEQLLASQSSDTGAPGTEQTRILRAFLALYWCEYQYFSGQMQASLQSARAALTWVTPGEAYAASLVLLFKSLARQATGQEEGALAELQQVLKDQSMPRNDTARLLFTQVLVYVAAGKLLQAEQMARHLLRLAQEAELPISQNYAHWMLGVMSYEWNQLDAAVYYCSVVLANQHCANFWALRDALCGLALAYHARGEGNQAQETADALLALTQEQHNLGEMMAAYAFRGQLALLDDEVEEAAQWLELAGEPETLHPLPFLEEPALTKAWMLLARGDAASVARGQALLTELVQQVEAMHSTRKMIQVLALQAWAYDLQGHETEALDALERALVLGRPGRFVRTFADLPPLRHVLAELRRRRKAQQEPDHQLDAYLQAILVAMSPKPSHGVSTRELMRQEGLEPLTERELQTLRLLERGLTNREIARELVVEPSTVKVHTKHVYRKLSVNNRRAAVTLARALGLLAAA